MLVCKRHVSEHRLRFLMKVAYDLLDDLAGGVEVNKALVNLELVAIPGLGTFTTGLKGALKSCRM